MNWDELAVGTGPEPRTVGPISLTDIVKYQGASGDFNPIHHDTDYARSSGFEQPVGVGMFHAGVMNSLATDWLGPDNLRRTRIRWKAPVFPGDVLTFAGAVTERWEEGGQRGVAMEVAGHRGDTLVVQGWMRFVVAS